MSDTAASTKVQVLEILSSLAEQKRKTGGQDTRVSFRSLLQTHLENVATVKETINLFVFGLSGVGKSTAINTIFAREVRKTARGYSGEAGPLGVTKDIDPVDLFTITSDSGKTCKLVLWDVPGLTGRRGGFDFDTELQEKIPDPDLTLLCVPMDANNGRPLPSTFESSFQKLKSIKDGVYTRNSIVLLTKANLVADAFEKEYDDRNGHPSDGWHVEFSERVADWKKVVEETIEDLGLPPMPALEFGKINFRGDEVKSITTLGPLGKSWILNAYSEMLHSSGSSEMTAVILLRSLQFASHPIISQHLKTALPGPGVSALVPHKTVITKRGIVRTLTAAILPSGVASDALVPFAVMTTVALFAGKSNFFRGHSKNNMKGLQLDIDEMYTVDEFKMVLEHVDTTGIL